MIRQAPAVNRWLQQARIKYREVALDPAGFPEGHLAPAVAERLDLDAALARLPPDARLCVVLAYSEGMSHAEICDEALLQKIQYARRIRVRRQLIAIGAVTGCAALNLRLVLEYTASAARFVGDISPAFADLLITPWGWAASMLIGAWVVLRTRPSRR